MRTLRRGVGTRVRIRRNGGEFRAASGEFRAAWGGFFGPVACAPLDPRPSRPAQQKRTEWFKVAGVPRLGAGVPRLEAGVPRLGIETRETCERWSLAERRDRRTCSFFEDAFSPLYGGFAPLLTTRLRYEGSFVEAARSKRLSETRRPFGLFPPPRSQTHGRRG